MNTRINELLVKCTQPSIDGIGNWVDQDKLIKLIIAECADTIDTWGDSGRFKTFGQRLKAHFDEN